MVAGEGVSNVIGKSTGIITKLSEMVAGFLGIFQGKFLIFLGIIIFIVWLFYFSMKEETKYRNYCRRMR